MNENTSNVHFAGKHRPWTLTTEEWKAAWELERIEAYRAHCTVPVN